MTALIIASVSSPRSYIFALIVTAALLGFCNTVIIATDVTTMLTCSAPNGLFPPTWLVNGSAVGAVGHQGYRSIINGMQATLTLDGNHTYDSLNVACKVFKEGQFLPIINLTLTIRGRLPSPKSIHIMINESAAINVEWNPPYSSVNSESDSIIRVDPHISQYTVYITDIHTGSTIVKKNITGTQFTTNIQSDVLCPMYQVSAWNAGGEGELSEPVQESTPQVPRTIAAENIGVTSSVKSTSLHVHIDVDVVCSSRMPKFFHITVMNSSGRILRKSKRLHQPGQTVEDFEIRRLKNVDVCTLLVKIRAGNSAGMSAPSEAVEVDCSGESTDSTTSDITGGGSEGNKQQGVSTTLIAVIIGVTIAVGAALMAAATIGIVKFRNYTRINGKVPRVVYVNSQQTTSGQFTIVQTQTSSMSSSMDNERSGDLLPQPNTAAPAESPYPVVYLQINTKQTHVQPPDNDNHMQYAQVEHQDKL